MQKSISKNKLTNDDLDAISGLLDKQAAVLARKEDVEEIKASMATKQDLLDSETSLKTYMHEGFEAVMTGMDNLAEQMAEKEKVEKLLVWAREAGEKIGVRPRL